MAFTTSAVMYFYSGPPMHLRSGVDLPSKLSRASTITVVNLEAIQRPSENERLSC